MSTRAKSCLTIAPDAMPWLELREPASVDSVDLIGTLPIPESGTRKLENPYGRVRC
jgi:hypothetical protein